MTFTTKKMKLTAGIAMFMLGFLIFAPQLSYADQPEGEEETDFKFTDEELLHFFDANQEISGLRRDMQEKMSTIVEAEGVTLDRFNQIARANQIGALQGGAFTDDEVEAFNILGPQISQVQREQQTMVNAIIEAKGFNQLKYQEIMNNYRSDEALQAHTRELLRERRRQEILEERRKEAEEKAAAEGRDVEIRVGNNEEE